MCQYDGLRRTPLRQNYHILYIKSYVQFSLLLEPINSIPEGCDYLSLL
jgi:hypothetical protein